MKIGEFEGVIIALGAFVLMMLLLINGPDPGSSALNDPCVRIQSAPTRDSCYLELAKKK